MKKIYFLLYLLSMNTIAIPCKIQQLEKTNNHIKSASQKEHIYDDSRKLQYFPDEEEFVCINGKNRFTRALYGTHTSFRLETSDRPVFASYISSNNCKHICFKIQLPNKILALDSLQFCEARYNAGKRSYLLADPSLNNGKLHVAALALPDREGAIWKFKTEGLENVDMTLIGLISEIRNPQLFRDGDMGVEIDNSLEMPSCPKQLEFCKKKINRTLFVLLDKQKLSILPFSEGAVLFEKAEKVRSEIASRISINTPDPYFNTLGGTLAIAADGIWDGEVWLHGAIGWRMPLNGWRAAYIGDVLGWHDRARTHFNAYAKSQVTEIPNTIPHPTQDSVLHLARSVKKWGTPHYSNGYICRNPNSNDQMHHYDMNLCYIDELLWHFNWTGDLSYVRQMWPIITRHLAWEKLNYDPDNDGLYDAYCCIWASDALYYNSGAVTHSSAYNYRANKMAAQLAEKIGEDPTPYHNEAEKILKAMNERLWLPFQGHWAEYQDFMGHKRVHKSAAVWTIYHAIDSEMANPFQAYQATRYVDTAIPHIPVTANGLKDYGYATISTTNWLPYSWSINNVAMAEVAHTSLAYFQTGRNDSGYKLLKSAILDAMYIGNSPGNFGQTSFYDAARGECYRDFGDVIGITSRALIQGLFGIIPDALNERMTIRPGFPIEWDTASISIPDIAYQFVRKGNTDTYHITQQFKNSLTTTLQLNASCEDISEIKVNGISAKWEIIEIISGFPVIAIKAPATDDITITIKWKGNKLYNFTVDNRVISVDKNFSIAMPAGLSIAEIYDPQNLLDTYKLEKQQLKGYLKNGVTGHHTFFVRTNQGKMSWWQPINIYKEEAKSKTYSEFTNISTNVCRVVNMDNQLNASISDIFQTEYLSPRSPYTTLQLPIQGIGEWCHPLLTSKIDDSGLRKLTVNDIFKTSIGIPFRIKAKGNNILFTSLWDNYPDSATIPLSGSASHAYLLMAGSTNHMQCHIVNGIIHIHYTDGSVQNVELVNPDNWCPIEQDLFIDGKAFRAPEPRPYRLHLKTGKVSRNLWLELMTEKMSDNKCKLLSTQGVYGREIDGGAGILLDIPLDPTKKLQHLTLETVSNDVVIGIIGVTLQ